MDAETVAKGLSAAQRKMVIASEPDDITGEEGCGVELRGSGYRVAKSLAALGVGNYTHGSSSFDMYWNYSKGLDVRYLLLKGE